MDAGPRWAQEGRFAGNRRDKEFGWRANKAARPEIARMAELLEGRCRTILAAQALRHGNLAALADNLFMTDGHVSPAPLLSIAHGGIDWVGLRLGRRD